MSANGNLGRLMVMEFILGLMVTGMKDSSKNASSMERGYKNLQMAIFIKDFMQMVNHVDLVSTIGQTEAILKELLRMG